MTDNMKFRYYAIDFDDTIAYSEFPLIKRLVPHADRVIRRIKENGGQIAIWTCRTGEHLESARKFLESNNIPYDIMNEEFPEIAELFGGSGRKIFADLYIDDKGVDTVANGGIDWLKIERMIFGDNNSLLSNGEQLQFNFDNNTIESSITGTNIDSSHIIVSGDIEGAEVIKPMPLTKG